MRCFPSQRCKVTVSWMPLVVTQLPSVYGYNLSLTGAVFMTVAPPIGLLLAKKAMLLWCIHRPQLKINDYYLTNYFQGRKIANATPYFPSEGRKIALSRPWFSSLGTENNINDWRRCGVSWHPAHARQASGGCQASAASFDISYSTNVPGKLDPAEITDKAK